MKREINRIFTAGTRAELTESNRINITREAADGRPSGRASANWLSAVIVGLALYFCTVHPALSDAAADLPLGTLGWHVWTNVLEKSYGCDDSLYSKRSRPDGWVDGTSYTGTGTPALEWSTNGLLRQFTNYTAISQMNSFCGCPGQMPVTLLTRRHAYMRGHDTVHDGDGNGWTVKTNYAGQRVWFCDENNNVVTATVKASFGGRGVVDGSIHYTDFVVLLFEEDVPSTIANMPVCLAQFYYEEVKVGSWDDPGCHPRPLQRATYITISQCNKVGIFPHPTRPGFPQEALAGDSGSPEMLPVRDGLVMFGGATTTGLGSCKLPGCKTPFAGPEPGFNADTFVQYAVEELNKWAGLDSRDPAYNLEYADLSEFGLANGSNGCETTNGVPVLWLEQHGLSTNGSDDDVDSDGDGLSNAAEWAAGTDPTDSTSVLRLWTPVYSPAGMLITWNSQTNCTYWIKRAEQFSFPMQWTLLSTNVPGEPTQTTFLDQEVAPGQTAFYCVGSDSPQLEAPVNATAPIWMPARITLRWNSVAGKVYVIERAACVQGPFTVLQDNIEGQAGVTSFEDINDIGDGPLFYRVGVR